MSDCPDSPEAVALSLFEHIIKDEDAQDRRRNMSREQRAREMLDLYAQCLAAVNGRSKAELALIH